MRLTQVPIVEEGKYSTPTTRPTLNHFYSGLHSTWLAEQIRAPLMNHPRKILKIFVYEKNAVQEPHIEKGPAFKRTTYQENPASRRAPFQKGLASRRTPLREEPRFEKNPALRRAPLQEGLSFKKAPLREGPCFQKNPIPRKPRIEKDPSSRRAPLRENHTLEGYVY